MTLAELVRTNGHIGLIEAEIRGDERGESWLVTKYRIGARAEYYPSEYDGGVPNENAVHLVQKPIHVRDAGASSFEFGQVMQNIPKEIANLGVMGWSCRTEFLNVEWWGEKPVQLRVALQSEYMARQRRHERKVLARQKGRSA